MSLKKSIALLALIILGLSAYWYKARQAAYESLPFQEKLKKAVLNRRVLRLLEKEGVGTVSFVIDRQRDGAYKLHFIAKNK